MPPLRMTYGLVLLGLWIAGPGGAQMQSLAISRSDAPEATVPDPLKDLGFDQNLGSQIPVELSFIDSTGQEVELASLLDDRPLILAPVYYECPMLCSLVLDGVVRSLKPLRLKPGEDLQVVAVSFDPRETPVRAAQARRRALGQYGGDEAEAGWHFLTGPAASVAELMDAVGLRYRYDEESGEYAHAGGIVVLTPEGRISRYFFGVDYAPKEVQLALVEASGGKIGSLAEKLFLFCFRYDPTLGKYSAVVMNIVQLASGLTVLLLAGALIVFWRRERRHGQALEGRV